MEVGPEGVVTSWTWVDTPNPNHPLDRPFAFALIQLDGADTAMVHVVDGGARRHQHRRAGRSRVARRAHRLRDRHRVLRVVSPVSPDDRGQGRAAHHAVPGGAALRGARRARGHPLRRGAARRQDHRAAVHRRVRPGLRAAARLLPHRRDQAHRPTTTSCSATPARSSTSRSITPVQYPGQEETEPFVRASIAARRRRRHAAAARRCSTRRSATCVSGMRVPRCGARSRSATPTSLAAGGWSGTDGGIEGWMPTGEPDARREHSSQEKGY